MSERMDKLQEEARTTSQRLAEFEAQKKTAKESDKVLIEAAIDSLKQKLADIGQKLRRLGGIA